MYNVMPRIMPPCCNLMHELPITKSSTLADLRAFISDNSLDVKTTGKGRTKAVIYREIVEAVNAAHEDQRATTATPTEQELAMELAVASELVETAVMVEMVPASEAVAVSEAVAATEAVATTEEAAGAAVQASEAAGMETRMGRAAAIEGQRVAAHWAEGGFTLS